MKSHALPILCMLLALAGCQAPAASDDDAGFANPLVRQRADPHVTLHPDGWYYLTATVPEYDRIELRRARSLAELGKAEARVVWRKHASGEMGAHIWAPELHRIDGKWYLYFSAGRADKVWEIRLYVLENSAENPFEGEWIERGQLKTGWESFALDATTFAHRGQRYLSWTQVAPDGSKGTNIYLARMDGPLAIRQPAVLLTRPEHAWERIGHWVNEAPAVLVKHGRVLMTYSASATDANYALGLLWAQEDADLLDPAAWTKSPQPGPAQQREDRPVWTWPQQFYHQPGRQDRHPGLPCARLSRHRGRAAARPEPPHAREGDHLARRRHARLRRAGRRQGGSEAMNSVDMQQRSAI